MKSLVRTTKETPRAMTFTTIIALVTGLADLVIGASDLLGLPDKTIGIIGFGVAALVFVINTIQNNRTGNTMLMLAFFLFSSSVFSQPQTDIRNQLEQHEATNTPQILGCCFGDPDNHEGITNESQCAEQNYVIDTSPEAGGDYIYTGQVKFRHANVSIVGGGNFVINSEAGAIFQIGTETYDEFGNLLFTCPATSIIEGSTQMFLSMSEFQTLSIENFIVKNKRFPENMLVDIYSTTGQTLYRVSTNNLDYKSLNQGFYILRFNDLKAFKHIKI